MKKKKKCIDCGQQFADTLSACPNCGCPANLCDNVTTQQPIQPEPQLPKLEHVAQQPVASGNGMIDTSKLFIFFIIAGSLALLGALVVICSDTMRGVASLMYAMFFILLSMGIALIGLGVSISRK